MWQQERYNRHSQDRWDKRKNCHYRQATSSWPNFASIVVVLQILSFNIGTVVDNIFFTVVDINYVTNFIQLVSLQQWTYFHKLSCTGKPQMRAICTYVGCTKATTNNWDIRSSVTVKALFANISWKAKQIHTIKLALESTHQFVSNDI